MYPVTLGHLKHFSVTFDSKKHDLKVYGFWAKILPKNIKGISPGSITVAQISIPFDTDPRYIEGLSITSKKTKNEKPSMAISA